MSKTLEKSHEIKVQRTHMQQFMINE